MEKDKSVRILRSRERHLRTVDRMPEKVDRLRSVEIGPREIEETRLVGDADRSLDEQGTWLVTKKSPVFDLLNTERIVAEEGLRKRDQPSSLSGSFAEKSTYRVLAHSGSDSGEASHDELLSLSVLCKSWCGTTRTTGDREGRGRRRSHDGRSAKT